jgi:hypothetical protein
MSTLSLFDLDSSKATKDQVSLVRAGLMSPQDKVKLDSIEASANKYIHPDTHPATLITGLATVATTGNYTDLTNTPIIPTSLPANGGNADTLDSFHSSDFTPVSHIGSNGVSHAAVTTTTNGFMIATDKTKLDTIILLENTSVGLSSLYSNQTGTGNTILGRNSLYSNTTGNYNTAIGFETLKANITGNYNVVVGGSALLNNTASNNTAIGYASMNSNTTGTENTAIGKSTLQSNTIGNYNVAIGNLSLFNNTTSDNIAIGYRSMNLNTTGTQNTVIGRSALQSNIIGNYNTAIGYATLINNTESNNTAIGNSALYANITGKENTALGVNAGRYITNGLTANTTSDYSIYIGNATKASADNNQNEIVIGYNATGKGSNTIQLGNSSVTDGYIGNNKIWTTANSGNNSGLDADSVDSKHISDIYTKTAGESTPYPLISTAGGTSSMASIIGNWQSNNYIGFGATATALKLGIVNTTNGDWKDQDVDLYVNTKKVWTSGNQGLGSTMDSDLVDGVHANDINGTPIAGYFASPNYSLIGVLPVSNNATYDKIYIELIGGAQDSTGLNCDHIVLANRGSFAYVYNKGGVNTTRGPVKIVAYRQTDGSVNIYVVANGYYAAIVSAKATYINGNQSTLKMGVWNTTTPTGTILFDSTISPTNYYAEYVHPASHSADIISINATNYSNVLNTSVTNVQLLADTVNNLTYYNTITIDADNSLITGSKKADTLCWNNTCVYNNTSTSTTVLLMSLTLTKKLRFGKYYACFRLRSTNNTLTTDGIKLDILKNVSGTMTSQASRNIKANEFTTTNTYQCFYVPFEYTGAHATNEQFNLTITLLSQTLVYEVALDSIIIAPVGIGVFSPI